MSVAHASASATRSGCTNIPPVNVSRESVLRRWRWRDGVEQCRTAPQQGRFLALHGGTRGDEEECGATFAHRTLGPLASSYLSLARRSLSQFSPAAQPSLMLPRGRPTLVVLSPAPSSFASSRSLLCLVLRRRRRLPRCLAALPCSRGFSHLFGVLRETPTHLLGPCSISRVLQFARQRQNLSPSLSSSPREPPF